MTTLANAGVVEFRRYRLRSAAHVNVLHDLFQRYLIAGQSAAGMRIGRLYRDADAPEEFVWWRGFADMRSRRTALQAFYEGPVWAAHRDAANATMLESDDVLLLRWAAHAASAEIGGRGQACAVAAAMVIRNLHHRDADEVASRVHASLMARLDAGASVLVSETAVNDFARLPVRPEPTLVWQASFATARERDDAVVRLSDDLEWVDLISGVCSDPEIDIELLRLDPIATQRSVDH